MSATDMVRADDATRLTLRLLGELFAGDGASGVGVCLWNGVRWPDDAPREVTLVLKHPGALRAMFLPGHELGLAEAYLYDDFDIQGNVEAVFGLADHLAEATAGWRKKVRAARQLLRLPADAAAQSGAAQNGSAGGRTSRRGPARLSGQQHSIFSDAYVFPDGELVPINVTLHAAEENGFEVRDVESLREHYALTLRHWVRRLEAHHEEALRVVDESTYRVWRLYMAGSAHGFATQRLNVYQALLTRPDHGGESHLPLTRTDWYR